jgi:hypothetical protein
VIVNAGGIVAYYPSKYPLHSRAFTLGDRDFYGEIGRPRARTGWPWATALPPKKDSPPALRVGPNPALNRVKSISENWSAETPVSVGCRPFCFSAAGPTSTRRRDADLALLGASCSRRSLFSGPGASVKSLTGGRTPR